MDRQLFGVTLPSQPMPGREFCFDGYRDRGGNWKMWFTYYGTWLNFCMVRDS